MLHWVNDRDDNCFMNVYFCADALELLGGLDIQARVCWFSLRLGFFFFVKFCTIFFNQISATVQKGVKLVYYFCLSLKNLEEIFVPIFPSSDLVSKSSKMLIYFFCHLPFFLWRWIFQDVFSWASIFCDAMPFFKGSSLWSSCSAFWCGELNNE